LYGRRGFRSTGVRTAPRWDVRRCQFYFALRPGSCDSESRIGFLEQLRRQRRVFATTGLRVDVNQ
jgi:hypothetical protein